MGTSGKLLLTAGSHPAAESGLEVRQLCGRRAKIVCTVGPASSSEAVLRDLLRTGMDVARLNFSHGTHEEHARMIERIRRAAAREGRSVGILQDLAGPKIRTGRLKYRTPIVLRRGAKVTITPRDIPGTASLLSSTIPIGKEVSPGSRILLADGLIELRVKAVPGDDVECEVLNGGMLGEHKGINLPGTPLSVPSLTEKDKKDLLFGLKHGIDLLAISFVRTAEDVLDAKRFMAAQNVFVPIIAKLEKPQAIDNLEAILQASEGVMVARGDLGVEMPAEKIPAIQKLIIQRATDWRKPVITATQMLESMVENPRPTRAEVSDVANAVFDGSDAVMLSAESASGKYPRESTAMMAKIVSEAEHHMGDGARRRRTHRQLSIPETICESVAHAAEDLAMRAIAVFTETGTTARLISKYRPNAPVFAFTPFPQVCNRLNLFWGVQPAISRPMLSAEEMVRTAEKYLVQRGAAIAGDVIGVVAGTQMSSGSTNFMRLHVIGAKHNAVHEHRRTPRIQPANESTRR
jgi:pyruvate kinase